MMPTRKKERKEGEERRAERFRDHTIKKKGCV